MTYQDSGSTDNPERDPDEQRIVSEIEETRYEMGATIDEIGHRLQPQTIADEAREKIREATVGRVEKMVDDVGTTAQNTSNNLIDTIRENPVPAALAAMGIGWLALKVREQSSTVNRYQSRGRYQGNGGYDYGYQAYAGSNGDGGRSGGDPMQSARRVAGDVAGTAQEAADDAVRRAQQVGADVQQATASAVGTAQQAVQQGQWQAQAKVSENPLAMAALALGVGAAVGLALPETQRERELMGEQSNRLVEKASEVATQALDQTQAKVQEVVEQTQS